MFVLYQTHYPARIVSEDLGRPSRVWACVRKSTQSLWGSCKSYWRALHCVFQVLFSLSETSQIFHTGRFLLEKTGIQEHSRAYFTAAGASSPRNFSFLSFLGGEKRKQKGIWRKIFFHCRAAGTNPSLGLCSFPKPLQ